MANITNEERKKRNAESEENKIETNMPEKSQIEQLAEILAGKMQPQAPAPKERAVKHVEGDYIGAKFQPLVGNGEGLTDYEEWLVNMVMQSRPSTNPMRMIGAEGYPSHLEAIKFVRPSKSTPMAIDLDNKHRAGCNMASPGQPNHLLLWFPKGKVRPGMNIPTDMKWGVQGKELVIYWDKATAPVYQPV